MSNNIDELERLMQNASAIDSASTEISTGDDLDLDDLMPELDDINEEVQDVSSNVEDEDETDAVNDYKKARNHLNWALEVNQKMIVNNARISKVTTHPKNFEAHDKLMQTHLKLCGALLEASGKVDESKVKARVTRTTKVVPDPVDDGSGNGHTYEGEVVKNSEGEHVRITRKPTSESLFEIVQQQRELETELGKTLSNEDIVNIAVELDRKKEISAVEVVEDKE